MREYRSYFPFAPGIPLNVKKGYILPKLDPEVWNRAFNRDKCTFVCNKGFLESVYTLCLIEAFHKKFPLGKAEFISNGFDYIYESQGLAKKSKHNITNQMLKKYPSPIFFDKPGNIYVNCLYSYINIVNKFGKYLFHNVSKTVFHQIYKNIMLSWEESYIPLLRKIEIPLKLKELCEQYKFNFKNKYIVIIADRTELSKHGPTCLNWNSNDIKSFVDMFKGTDYKVVIFSKVPHKYYGIKALSLPIRVDYILYMMHYANVILSEEIDFLLSALLISKAATFSLKTFDEFKIEKNIKDMQIDRVHYSIDDIRPINVFLKLVG